MAMEAFMGDLERRTAKKTRPRARDLKRRRDEYLARVTHELRNPLQTINFALKMNHLLLEQVVASTDPDYSKKKLREALKNNETLDRSVELLKRLVDDVSAEGLLGLNQLSINFEDVSVLSVVKLVMEGQQRDMNIKEIKLIQDFHNDPWIRADRVRLEQIFWNLLSNAIKFIPRHGTIEVYIGQTKDMVEVRIRDNGRGIPAEFLPHIFEPFERGGQMQAEGTGLGLGVVKDLVHLQHGEVKVESEGAGAGATFTVRFPVLRR